MNETKVTVTLERQSFGCWEASWRWGGHPYRVVRATRWGALYAARHQLKNRHRREQSRSRVEVQL